MIAYACLLCAQQVSCIAWNVELVLKALLILLSFDFYWRFTVFGIGHTEATDLAPDVYCKHTKFDLFSHILILNSSKVPQYWFYWAGRVSSNSPFSQKQRATRKWNFLIINKERKSLRMDIVELGKRNHTRFWICIKYLLNKKFHSAVSHALYNID